MNINIHKLDTQHHSHVIGRKDGVTGDNIKANDEIVFCAACQSVFLKESWEYMNLKHCNQSETLDFIPRQASSFFAKKREKFNFEFSDYSSSETLQVILTTISASVLLVLFPKLFKETAFYITTFSALTLSILFGFLAKTTTFRETFGVNIKKVKITEKGIELKGEYFYSFQEIDAIEYVKTFETNHLKNKSLINNSKTPSDNSLYIIRKNKLAIRHKLPNKSIIETENFLFALAHSAPFVQLNFYTKNTKEKNILKNLKNEYGGKINILKVPNKYLF
ncbi:hypothetical protein WAF17_21760 [Bernardetia sp. ABR2-2B]|uniref:hypothetical protein n=1 Tax=Bernardetia sp. ABR2-2B TaxID=3127472 RepID=UPI0030D58B20